MKDKNGLSLTLNQSLKKLNGKGKLIKDWRWDDYTNNELKAAIVDFLNRDDVRDQISSSFTASGSLVKYEQEIKNDILSYIDGLLDEEIETIHQIAQLQKGEIQPTDVDVAQLMEMGQKLNKHLMDIVRKYRNN